MKILKNTLLLFIFLINTVSATSFNLNERQKNKLQEIEKLYNNYNIIKSRFIQTDNLGNHNQGWFIIEKPGKARIEYNDLPIRLIANAKSLMLQDIDRKQKSFIPLISNPFAYLLEDKISFFDKKITITNYKEHDNFLEISMKSSESPALGEISLFLTLEKGEIIKWLIKDAKGIQTQVFLVQATFSQGELQTKGIFNIQRVKNLDYKDIN